MNVDCCSRCTDTDLSAERCTGVLVLTNVKRNRIMWPYFSAHGPVNSARSRVCVCVCVCVCACVCERERERERETDTDTDFIEIRP